MQALEEIDVADWAGPFAPDVRQRAAEALESGKVVFLPRLGLVMDDSERALLSADLAKGNRKNITLDPKTGTVQGTDLEGEQRGRLQHLLQRFSQSASGLLGELIPAYKERVERARTTFRPIEIAGREYTPKKDDRRLHVDAFPSRPTHGRRILRLFTNVNPDGKPRVWRVGEPFEDFAKTFLPRLRKPSALQAWMLNTLGITKGRRSPYDQLMLQLHDRGKLDAAYQGSAPHQEIAFPPHSTWMCFTDQVLHAALAGQFALEQTFHLDVGDMVDARRSPIRTLERMTGTALG